jgi:hypothetical protein
LPSSFFPPLYLTTAFAPSIPPADMPPIIAAVNRDTILAYQDLSEINCLMICKAILV